MVCRYCERDRKLVEAHILPRAFYQHLRASGDTPLIIPGAEDEHIATSHTGEYDSDILCEECERKFSPYDSYGKSFFLDTKWEQMPRHAGSNGRIIEVGNADYRLLKLFILSVLLRAHWTTRPFFGVVDIGRHAQTIRDMVERGDAGDVQLYGMTIFRFESDVATFDPRLAWRNPGSARVEGIRMWGLWFHQFGALIKMDQRPLPFPLSHLSIAPGGPVPVVTRDFLTSREFQAMSDITRLRAQVDERRRTRTD